MNEFLEFITAGTIENFSNKPKDKLLYLSRIFYYSFALLFSLFIIYEIVLYQISGGIEATVIVLVDDVIDKDKHLNLLINLLISPLLVGFALWWCLTQFCYRKTALSFALIISVTIYKFNLLPNILPPTKTVYGYDFMECLAFIFLVGILYLIFINSASNKRIKEIEKIWDNNLNKITYIYTILFSLYMLTFIALNIINIVGCIIVSLFIGLMLVYVRRLLGYIYAIILHYALLLPIIIIMIYTYMQQ